MILPIYTYGEKVLKETAKKVDLDDPTLPELINNMYETMRLTNIGIGLAAPQVGVSKKIFILEKDDDEDEIFQGVFINPKILYSGQSFHEMPEPCLSFPGVVLNVKRPTIIGIEWYDEKKQYHKEDFNDIHARVILHEMDHLNGVLITDRTHRSELNKNKIKLDNIRSKKTNVGYLIFKPDDKEKK